VRFIEEVEASVGPILAVFVAAALLAFLLTPAVRRVVLRHRIVDRPNSRRVNTRPVARAGGLAIAGSFLLVAAGFVFLNERVGWLPVPPDLHTNELIALFVGGVAAATIGAIDDLLDLRARWQLVGQLALALFAVVLGIGIAVVGNPLGSGVIRFSEPFSIGFTVFWIIGMINSINWIDGLDGLSSGIAFVLGEAKVAVALLVLGVPIIDTFWIIVGRIVRGGSPFAPDRSHIHHRLLDLGLSHRDTVLVIYGICGALAVFAMLVSEVTQLYAFLGVFLVSGLILFGPTRGAFRRPEELEADAYDSDR
jgi:UDP-N-acetylmuramyl pentapeptide phosphotransferase/UDP-N-acetylglucosamine-1-phosphate transferase